MLRIGIKLMFTKSALKLQAVQNQATQLGPGSLGAKPKPDTGSLHGNCDSQLTTHSQNFGWDRSSVGFGAFRKPSFLSCFFIDFPRSSTPV